MKTTIGIDIDGTILPYGAAKDDYRGNADLIHRLPPAASTNIILVTNQAGINFIGDRYPTPAEVANRIHNALLFLGRHGYFPRYTNISVFHPRTPYSVIEISAKRLRRALHALNILNFSIYATEKSRKPQPYMLRHPMLETYYGDSDEDRAAADAAGIPFVRIERFV